MAWEERNGKAYYYRKRRVGTQVRSEYVGSGVSGEGEATEVARDRAERAAARARWKAERAVIEADDGAYDAMADVLALLTRGVLLANGYHRHKRQWRRRRDT